MWLCLCHGKYYDTRYLSKLRVADAYHWAHGFGRIPKTAVVLGGNYDACVVVVM